MELFERICANPDDDALKLVWADELLSRDDPRGELVAVQCELARLGRGHVRPPATWIGDALAPDPWDAAATARTELLRRRESELLQAHAAQWAGDAAPYNPRFYKGFVAELAVGAALARRKDPVAHLVACAPLLESIFLSATASGPIGRNALKSPSLARVRSLFLTLRDVESFRALAESPFTGAVRSLAILSGCPAAAFLELMASELLGRVEVLDLDDQGLGPEFGDALVAAPRALREVHLGNAALGPEGAGAIARSEALARLEVLSLRSNRVDDGVLDALVNGPLGGGLVALNLQRNQLTAWSFATIAGGFPKLSHLVLSGNPLKGAELQALGDAGGLSSLTSLSLSQTGFDDASLDALLAAPFAPQLRALDLAENEITEAGVDAIAARGTLLGLQVLRVRYNAIDSDALAKLCAALPDTRVSG